MSNYALHLNTIPLHSKIDWYFQGAGRSNTVPEWEITVTTLRCAAVNDEVTIMIDGTSHAATCTWHARRASRKSGAGTAGCSGRCALITETLARFQR
jgi:hypothetical protein